MPTNTSGGTTTSFMNTPQAVDDLYDIYEDSIYTFDVMSNDLGGNAKILWSIDDSNLDGTYGVTSSGNGTYDLLSKDAACVPECSDLGARIWIEAGKIRYDASKFNYLGATESVTDRFTYAIRMSNGTLSWATVTITIAGTNDGPVVVAADLQGSVTEDASLLALTDTGTITFDDPDLTDSHSTTVTAAAGNSLGGTLTALITDPATGAGDGIVTWNYSVANSATQYLAQGQTVTESFTVRITDSSGGYVERVVVVTITGTNDLPTVSVADLAGAATEDTASPNLTDSGTITFDDVDLSDTHSTNVTPDSGNTLGGTLTASVTDAATGAGDGTVTWNYSVANSATQYLAQGQTATETFTIRISDNNGGFIDQVVVITITGTNDLPDIRAAVDDSASATIEETNSALSASGTLTVTDADTTDTISTTIVLTNMVGPNGGLTNAQLLAMLSVAPATGLAADTGNANNLAWNFSSGSQTFDFLAVGESLQLTYTLTVSDGNGGGDTQTVTVTIQGTNDAPTIVSAVDQGDVTEKAEPAEGGALSDAGTIVFADADLSDTHSASVSATVLDENGDPIASALGALTLGPVDQDSNTVGWSFSVDDADLDFLAAGQTLTQVYTITVSDGQPGGTVTQDVTITITGTNDAPTVTGAVDSGGVTEDGTLSASGSIDFADVDLADVHTATFLAGGLGYVGTFSVGVDDNSTGDGSGQIGWDFSVDNSAIQYLAVGQQLIQTYTVTIDDGEGGTVDQLVTITITGTNDRPDIRAQAGDSASATIDETNSALSASGTLTVTDVDTADAISTSVGLTNVSGNQGTLTNLQLAAMLSVAPVSGLPANTGDANNLSWNFSSGSQTFDFLAADESLQLTYTLTVSDGNGGTDTQTVTVTIEGTNDDPVLTVDASGVVTEDAADPTLTDSGTLSFTDADANDTHTVGATYNGDALWTGGPLTPAQIAALTAGFAVDSNSWDYSLANAAVQFLGEDETITLSFDVTVTDNQGGSDTETVTITVTGTNDDPNIRVESGDSASRSINETNAGLSTGGNLTVTDVDTTDTISTSVALTTISGNQGSLTAAALGAMLSVTPATGLAADTGNANNLAWSFNSGSEAFNYLTPGQTLQLTYTLTVSDGNGGTDTQTVTVTINGTNDAPVLTGDLAATITEGGTYTLTSADLNFTDPDDGAAGVTFTVSGLSNGTLFVNGIAASSFTGAQLAAGLVTFTHNGSETLLAGFNVTVEDGNEDGSAPVAQPFSFTVTPVNDAPVAAPVTLTAIAEDSGARVITQAELLAGVTDVDGPSLTITALGIATGGGSLVSNGNGTWTYTPALDDDTSVTFNYTASDGSLTSSSTATMDITPVADFIYVPPPPFTGTGDPNDFDSLGNPLGQNLSSTATNGNDTIYGGAGADIINGGGGDDTIYGGSGGDNLGGGADGDRLFGGSGVDTIGGGNNDDRIVGGYGADNLTGNNGADTFVYLSNLDTGDTITDFSQAQGDRIDLTAFAPSSFVGLLTNAGAVGPNQVGYMINGATTTIYVDTDGIFGADLEIRLTGSITLNSGDFILGGP